MELTKIRIGAVVEVDAKHAKKIARYFNDLLDGLPARIANTTVLERMSDVEGKPNGKQASRSGGNSRSGVERS
ncbi:MAG: hypothetical protein AB7I42_26055 [Bradyrhizobium sp.]|uniref:hypothetical protein n=1 Tax=Bradyrhizobium sp. TaxID=376 RepID=UPI003D103816